MLKRPAEKSQGKKAGLTAGRAASARVESTGKTSPPTRGPRCIAKRPAAKGRMSFPKARNAFQLFYAHVLGREKNAGRMVNANIKRATAEWASMTAESKSPWVQPALSGKFEQVQSRLSLGQSPRRTPFVKRACTYV